MTNNKFIEIHLDAETKQLAEQAAIVLGYSALSEFLFYSKITHHKFYEHFHIQLSHAQFEQFVEVCQTQNKVPPRFKTDYPAFR